MSRHVFQRQSHAYLAIGPGVNLDLGLHLQGHLLAGWQSCALSMVLGEQGPHSVFVNGLEVTRR